MSPGHRPKEEAEHFVDGWHRTGDRGHLDAEGHRHILGRAADCVVGDGRLVTPTGVGDTLMAASPVLVPLDEVPLTEQGKPDRTAILAHAPS